MPGVKGCFNFRSLRSALFGGPMQSVAKILTHQNFKGVKNSQNVIAVFVPPHAKTVLVPDSNAKAVSQVRGIYTHAQLDHGKGLQALMQSSDKSANHQSAKAFNSLVVDLWRNSILSRTTPHPNKEQAHEAATQLREWSLAGSADDFTPIAKGFVSAMASHIEYENARSITKAEKLRVETKIALDAALEVMTGKIDLADAASLSRCKGVAEKIGEVLLEAERHDLCGPAAIWFLMAMEIKQPA